MFYYEKLGRKVWRCQILVHFSCAKQIIKKTASLKYIILVYKKELFWAVSDLWNDFECFEGAELRNELSISLSRQDFLQCPSFSLKNGKNAIQTL